MANKTLKTIQFPGLPDTYTVPQVENGANNNVAVLDGAGNVKDSSIELSKVAKIDEINALKSDITGLQTALDKIENDALVKPSVAPSATSILAIDSTNTQTMLAVGGGLNVENGALKVTIDVQQTTGQSTTAVMSQKAVTDEINAIKNDLNTLSLGVYTDGLVYIFVNGKPVGTGVEFVKSGDVVGYVDDQKNIVITGDLADGTYTIKYENQDGSITEIGSLVIGSEPSYINLLPEAKSHTDLSTVFNSVGYMNNTRPSSATPFYSSENGYVTTGCFTCTFDSVFYIKGVTIDTSNSNCRLGFAGVQNNALNPYSVSSAFTNYASLETLGEQYYKVIFKSEYLQTNCPLLAYFFFGGIGSGENLIVSTTPI